MARHSHRENKKQANTDAHWSGVMAMTLCVFALIASEFMPVSLLTPVAQTLSISEGMAGQGITISGAFAVVTSLFILTVAGNLNRKYVLLGMTVLMALSGLIIGLAPNYTLYMFGRALIGIAIGGFWSLSAATAIRLVPARHVTRALAIFNGGNALATVVAAPLGSCHWHRSGVVAKWPLQTECALLRRSEQSMPDRTANTLAITGGSPGTTLCPISIPAFMALLYQGR